MPVKRAVNAALRRTTGHELVRAGAPSRGRASRAGAGARLLERPAFVLCSVRSGSTLLRVLLDSHSELFAPHELHLRAITVRLRTRYARRALAEAGLDRRELEYLLWDRLLHRRLQASGKRWLVNKTPNDVFIADRIRECWPDARFVFLLRHPAAIARSRAAARLQDDEERNVAVVHRYLSALERARSAHGGLIVRYEELTADPEAQLRRVCGFLDVAYEPAMLDYGRFEHGRYRAGLGDWSEKIRSGAIQPAPPPPLLVPEALRDLAAAWGYDPPAGA